VCVECLIGKQKKPILFKVTGFRAASDTSPVITGKLALGGASFKICARNGTAVDSEINSTS
jgi:hypothetical protein